MLCGKSITCFIPAKGTSYRLEDKNTKLCNGTPLVVYPYLLQKEAGFFDDHVVSTESEEVYEAVHRIGYTSVYRRPPELAMPHSNVWDAVRHFTQFIFAKYPHLISDYICLLQPTSPCVRPETLRAAFNYMLDLKFESLISVVEAGPYIIKNYERPDFTGTKGTSHEPTIYALNSAIHIIPWTAAAEGKSIYHTNFTLFPMAKDESVDIDTEVDFNIAEAILQWREKYD